MNKKTQKKPPEKEQKFLRINDLMKRYNFSRGHINTMIDEGLLPPPLILGKMKFWPKELIELHDENRLKDYYKLVKSKGFCVPNNPQSKRNVRS